MDRFPTKESKLLSTTSKRIITAKTSDTISSEKNFGENISGINWRYKLKKVNDSKIVLSQAHNNKFRFIGFDKWSNKVLDLIKSGKYIYEDFLMCRPFIDFEYKCSLESYIRDRAHCDKTALDRMKLMIKYIKSAMIEIIGKKCKIDIKITQSHGISISKNSSDEKSFKYSYHFVVNCANYRFKNSADAIRLVKLIEDNVEADKNTTKFIDNSVYKKYPESYQKMRCIFSRKSAVDDRTLVPIDENGNLIDANNINITDYLISYTKDNTKIQFIEGCKDNTNEKLKKKSKEKNNHASEKIVEQDESLLSDNAITVLKYLTNQIPSAYFVSCKKGASSGTMLYTYDYDHSDTCIHGSKHDRINGFAYMYESNVYAGCHSDTCKKKATKKIGSVNILEENWKNLPNVTNFSAKHIPDNLKIMKQIKSFVADDSTKILAIRSKIDSGKTRSVREIMTEYFEKNGKYKRVLAFSLRRSYADDVTNSAYKGFDFANYIDVESCDLPNKNRLVMSLESLHKLFVTGLEAYDVIILDELESLLLHFFSRTVNSSHECFEAFNLLMIHAKKIVCLDADLSISRSIKYLESISKSIKILKNNYRSDPRKYIFMDNRETYFSMIRDDLEKKKNICVVSISKNFGKNLKLHLEQHFPKLKGKICFVYGQCEKELKDQLKNVNENWSKYRVLIYNSVIGPGVNYFENHFHKVYSYITGGICPSRLILHMLGRIRNPENKDIITLIGKNVNKSTNSILYTREYARQYRNTLLPNVHTDKVIISYKDGDSTKFHIEETNTMWNSLKDDFIQETILNCDNKNILTMMKMLVDTNGDIYEEKYTGCSKKEDLKSDLDEILKTDMISDDEYKNLRKKSYSDLTENDKLTMKKSELRLQQNLNDSISNEDLNESIETFVKKESDVNRIKDVYKQDTQILQKTVTTTKQKSTQHDSKSSKTIDKKKGKKHNTIDYQFSGIKSKFADDLKSAKLKHYKSALKKIFDALNYGFDTEILTLTFDELNNLIKDIDFTSAEILSLDSPGRMVDNHQITKVVLSRLGIVMKADSKLGYDKNKKRIREKKYSIYRDEKLYQVVHNLITHEKELYDPDFVRMIDKYDKYSQHLI